MEHTNDHDLLIELKTEMKGLRADFRASTVSVASQLTTLQVGKLDRETFTRHEQESEAIRADHEARIRALEKALWRAVGALAVIQIVGQFVIKYFTS